MTKAQKTLLVTAALTGLVAGVVAKNNVVRNDQSQNVAGKPVSSETMSRNGCNGCGGKTNSVAKN